MSASEAFSAIEPELVRSFTRPEYAQMIALGLFQDERVELIQGVLVKRPPQSAPQASTIQKLNSILVARLQVLVIPRIHAPLALSEDTEPEPDIAVVALGDYEVEHPTTALLVIEVSDTTVRKDRRKASVYASAGIREYWIINLGARTVEVYFSPDGDRYAEVRTLRAGDTLRPTQLGDISIDVAEILPKA
jgi:Uma2 family endonuclease